MANDLSLFSYEILGLVGREGAGRTTCCAWPSAVACWPGRARASTTPSRSGWRSLGYLDTRKEPGKTRERTVYTLTDKGLAALRAYARTPVAPPPFKSDALLRLLVADLVGEKVTREAWRPCAPRSPTSRERVDEGGRGRAAPPTARKYLLLVYGFLRGLLNLHEELVDDVERKLSAPATAPRSARRAPVGRDGPRSAMKSPSIPRTAKAISMQFCRRREAVASHASELCSPRERSRAAVVLPHPLCVE